MTPKAMRHFAKATCVLAAAALLGVAPAKAQMFNPFGGYNGPTLTTSDYTVARAVVGKLLNEKPPVVGSKAEWNNPETGNFGTFTILSVYTANGMPCRKVQADVVYAKANSYPKTLTLSACQIPDGQWKTTT